jgi:hypothetical protein
LVACRVGIRGGAEFHKKEWSKLRNCRCFAVVVDVAFHDSTLSCVTWAMASNAWALNRSVVWVRTSSRHMLICLGVCVLRGGVSTIERFETSLERLSPNLECKAGTVECKAMCIGAPCSELWASQARMIEWWSKLCRSGLGDESTST